MCNLNSFSTISLPNIELWRAMVYLTKWEGVPVDSAVSIYVELRLPEQYKSAAALKVTLPAPSATAPKAKRALNLGTGHAQLDRN